MKLKLFTAKDLRTKKPAEISAYIADLKKARLELLEQLQTGKEKTTHQLKLIKRSIATAHTIANESKNAAAKETK